MDFKMKIKTFCLGKMENSNKKGNLNYHLVDLSTINVGILSRYFFNSCSSIKYLTKEDLIKFKF